jgi:hypothetical protein
VTEALIVAVALLLGATVFQSIRIDRAKALLANQKFYLEGVLAKALADRRSSVVMPAADLARAFGLDGRTLRDAREFAAKPGGPHPATMTPARRGKL